jgi:hypothetical protein
MSAPERTPRHEFAQLKEMPQLFVRTLGGSTLCLPREGTVKDIKRTVEEREGKKFDFFWQKMEVFFDQAKNCKPVYAKADDQQVMKISPSMPESKCVSLLSLCSTR